MLTPQRKARYVRGRRANICGSPTELHRDIGDVVIFPSFLAHKVTTVTRGTCHTMIALGRTVRRSGDSAKFAIDNINFGLIHFVENY